MTLGERPILGDEVEDANYCMLIEMSTEDADDPEKSEYFVPVKWLETRSEHEAVNEVGFFGNQNTVCKPTTPKWRHTVEKLMRHFKSWDAEL